jgi:hypothetical protein
LNNPDTLSQITEFSGREMTDTGKHIPFFMIVPKLCFRQLTDIVDSTRNSNYITPLYLP